MTDKKLTFREKSSIKFHESEDPPFLKQIKEKMGFKAPNIQDKVKFFKTFIIFFNVKLISKKKFKRWLYLGVKIFGIILVLDD